MVWDWLSSAGVSNLHFIEGSILKQNVKQTAEKLGIINNFAFYEGVDPKHTVEVAKLWLIYNCHKLLQTDFYTHQILVSPRKFLHKIVTISMLLTFTNSFLNDHDTS